MSLTGEDEVKVEKVFNSFAEARNVMELYAKIIPQISPAADLAVVDAMGSYYYTISARDEHGNEVIAFSSYDQTKDFREKHGL